MSDTNEKTERLLKIRDTIVRMFAELGLTYKEATDVLWKAGQSLDDLVGQCVIVSTDGEDSETEHERPESCDPVTESAVTATVLTSL